MKLPIVPILVATILLTLVVYLFNSTSSPKIVLDAPKVNQLVGIEGIETEVAVSPDGVMGQFDVGQALGCRG